LQGFLAPRERVTVPLRRRDSAGFGASVDGNRLAEVRRMRTQRPLLVSPLLTLLGAGALIVACSSADPGGVSSPYAHGGGSTSEGSGSASTGSTSPNTGASTPSSGNGATSSGATSGSSSASGTTGSGSTSGSDPSGGGTTASGGSSGGTSPPVSTPSDDAGSTTSSPPAAGPAFAVAVDNAAPSINLADTTVVNVTVTPQDWSGNVALSVTGLPTDVTGAFDNATLAVTGSTPVTAKLTLTSIDSSAPVATPFQIVGTVGSTAHNVAATLTVKSYITIVLPPNADSLPDSLGPTINITAPADIATNPVSINFLNQDSTPHEIHAENPKQGFPHGTGTFAQGQTDKPVRMVTVAGTYSWHLHDDPAPSAGGKGPNAASIVIK
jgi:hypothetical protein